MQSLIRSKSAGVTGGRGTAGAGPGRDLLYHLGRFERLRALLPKWAHEDMENCKTHTLLPTHRFGIATQAFLHEG